MIDATMPRSIVFFGTGPVAAASLRLLAQSFVIEAIVTKPRPPHHKGSVPVLELAQELQLPVRTVTNKASLDELIAEEPFISQLAVLIDFGIIVSQMVIDYFPLGIINSHFSLLPEWRGADPISFAVLSGQNITGVSLMRLVAAMDEGPLLGHGEQKIYTHSTTPSVTEQLVALSNALLVHHLPRVFDGTAKFAPQDITTRSVSYSRKLTKADSVLDFTKPAAELEREVRAFLGWPRSKTQIANTAIVITKAHVEPGEGAPGTLWLSDKQLGIYCQTDILVIDCLIPAGKKEMSGSAFITGYRPTM